jgi:hypothetical protein
MYSNGQKILTSMMNFFLIQYHKINKGCGV